MKTVAKTIAALALATAVAAPASAGSFDHIEAERQLQHYWSVIDQPGND